MIIRANIQNNMTPSKNPHTFRCKPALFRPSCKKPQTALQKAVNYTPKGHQSQCKRRPFEKQRTDNAQ